MKFALSLIFSFYFTISFAQKTYIDSTKIKEIQNVFLEANDSLRFNIGQLRNVDLRIIFDNKPDNFKYYFPIFTLLIGLFISQIIEWIKKRKETIRQGKRWIAELNFLPKSLVQQNKYLNTLLDELKMETPKAIDPHIIQKMDCKVFESLDRNNFISYLRMTTKKSYLESITLSSEIDSFIDRVAINDENLKIKIEAHLKNTSAAYSDLSVAINLMLAGFFEVTKQIVGEVKGDPNQYPNYKNLSDIIEKEIYPFRETGSIEPYAFYQNFIEPLRNIVKSFGIDEKIKPIYEAMVLIDLAIKKIKMENNYLVKNIEKIIFRNDEYEKQFQKLSNKFNKKRIAKLRSLLG